MYQYHPNYPKSKHEGKWTPWIPLDQLLNWSEEEGIFFKEFWSRRKHTPREAVESFVSWAIQSRIQFGADDNGEVHVRIPKSLDSPANQAFLDE